MKPTKYKEGQLVKAIFGLEDGRELIGWLDNFEEGDGEIEHSFSLGNLEDGECYAVTESDIKKILSKEVGQTCTFLGEKDTFGMVSGFDKCDPNVENKNPKDYKGKKCKVLQLIDDGEDCGCVTYEVEFKDGETAVVLVENLK